MVGLAGSPTWLWTSAVLARCALCQRMADTLVPAVQMLTQRVEALESGLLIRRDITVRGKTLLQVEREACIEALRAAQGRQNVAADLLNITPRVMHYKVHRLGLTEFCEPGVLRRSRARRLARPEPTSSIEAQEGR